METRRARKAKEKRSAWKYGNPYALGLISIINIIVNFLNEILSLGASNPKIVS